MKEKIKKIADHTPYSVGVFLNKIPMSLRLGRAYNTFKKNCTTAISDHTKAEQHTKTKNLLLHAINNTIFYKEFYTKNNFDPAKVNSFDDISKIPIVRKIDLQQHPIENRSVTSLALKKSNTGGTTGQPLNFYLEKNAYAREWAHMHAIWAKLGYHFTDEKITIRGRNIGNTYFKYNVNQNEFLINAYTPLIDNINACRQLILKRNIRWIHGYPSSITSFLKELENTDPVLFEVLISKIKGVFLGSEFPAPQYRSYIEDHCGLRTISWYGHSEMAVLAPELEPGSGEYYPFQSYGLAEAVFDNNSYRLIATSTYNYATPFIRYDTGDLIHPTFKDGILQSFRIKEGRTSESVTDLKGRSISLTGLIFGRHHKAFDHCEHVQVRQDVSGHIEIIISSKNTRSDWAELFDFTNSFFDIKYTQIDSPIRTPLGKVQLLLR